jgi:hypothetical protein
LLGFASGASANVHQQSVDNLSQYPPQGGRGEYAINPEQHHDAYYNQPYEPHPADATPGYDHGAGGYDYDDQRPMLTHNDSQVGASDPYHDNPQPPTNNAPIKRWKTVKQVLLYRGNLVLDCPIPPNLLNKLPHGERDEFTHMRYTAATCDPADFYDNNFTLRQKLFSKPRHTEFKIWPSCGVRVVICRGSVWRGAGLVPWNGTPYFDSLKEIFQKDTWPLGKRFWKFRRISKG